MTARTSERSRSRPDAAESAPDDQDCPWLDPGVDGAGLRVADFPSLLVLRLAAKIQRTLMPQYTHRFGLSLPEWRILPLLNRASPIQLSELTARSTLDKALISRAVRLLEEKGYVAVNGDPGHGRRLVVSITPVGRALHDRVLPTARRRQMALLAILDTGEREALYRLIGKLADAIDDGALVDDTPAPPP
ncbi:MAG TPA: MarR family transcriptional regulator [Hyphomicrobiales bacterium]|nr:MarR family transcriptional regulator [Hyphomicrobiales bacterium]